MLVGPGPLGKSLYLLLHVDIGLQPDHPATLLVAAPQASYPKKEQKIALQRQLVDRIASLPGVKSVGTTSDIPVTGWGDTTWFRVLGRAWHGEHNETPERDISPSYFTTLGAKLLRGRYFTEAEDSSKPRVAIINQAMAKQYSQAKTPSASKFQSLLVPSVLLKLSALWKISKKFNWIK
jgi:MacB-like periplasmic core domain